jgi:hypothetical protein
VRRRRRRRRPGAAPARRGAPSRRSGGGRGVRRWYVALKRQTRIVVRPGAAGARSLRRGRLPELLQQPFRRPLPRPRPRQRQCGYERQSRSSRSFQSASNPRAPVQPSPPPSHTRDRAAREPRNPPQGVHATPKILLDAPHGAGAAAGAGGARPVAGRGAGPPGPGQPGSERRTQGAAGHLEHQAPGGTRAPHPLAGAPGARARRGPGRQAPQGAPAAEAGGQHARRPRHGLPRAARTSRLQARAVSGLTNPPRGRFPPRALAPRPPTAPQASKACVAGGSSSLCGANAAAGAAARDAEEIIQVMASPLAYDSRNPKLTGGYNLVNPATDQGGCNACGRAAGARAGRGRAGAATGGRDGGWRQRRRLEAGLWAARTAHHACVACPLTLHAPPAPRRSPQASRLPSRQPWRPRWRPRCSRTRRRCRASARGTFTFAAPPRAPSAAAPGGLLARAAQCAGSGPGRGKRARAAAFGGRPHHAARAHGWAPTPPSPPQPRPPGGRTRRHWITSCSAARRSRLKSACRGPRSLPPRVSLCAGWSGPAEAWPWAGMVHAPARPLARCGRPQPHTAITARPPLQTPAPSRPARAARSCRPAASGTAAPTPSTPTPRSWPSSGSTARC